MTEADLEAFRRLSDQATPGPWKYVSTGTGIRGGGHYDFVVLLSGRGVIVERGVGGTPTDTEFIAAAVNFVRAYLASDFCREAADYDFYRAVAHAEWCVGRCPTCGRHTPGVYDV